MGIVKFTNNIDFRYNKLIFFKELSMKIVTLALVLLILNSCGGTNENGNFVVKNSLQKSNYYISDSCHDDGYAMYQFFDNDYKKTLYKDNNLENIKSSNSYKIDYLNLLQISLYENENIIDCTVAQNDQHSLTLVCINREFKDSNNSYSFYKTIWDSKELALKNRDFDCEN